ncbi:Glutathione s-transferase t1 [Thalictrum thalictroides]|uniref:Glutathione s-transferase t1 n=1 Tax=Thalictrum thalictroides TaxID=46969 RepID=A0A7J6VN58_THATH|nr:Glutathione s-transferase t1 [Thalictrum thalictroides]
MTTTLKIYAFRLSQPSRAIIIFSKANGFEFEEVKVPSIVHGDFNLFESHAILRYLACAFPGVPDHWYPTDLIKRAKINSVLDWHHSNLRSGAASYVLHTALAPAFGLPLNPTKASEAETVLTASLLTLESYWLKEDGKFLLGGSQPSIADISLVCEITELELLEEKDCNRILAPHKKVLQWIEDTRIATSPHFEEVHSYLLKTKAMSKKQSSEGNYESESSIRAMLSTI